ncbi:MAG: hypothetical protein ACRD3G_10590 [Vicinamibacterales bacterium]
MSSFQLNLPTDIPWERICHTEDMADTNPCDQTAPPKWQSSIAVFRYVPDEEYQRYDKGRRLIYYKVSCTISSYQPQSDEVQGALAQTGVLTTGEARELKKKLESFAPCNGAIVQVTVAPHEEGIPVRDYPYIADVQPTQRALYEQVTDTNEVASRSFENLNVRKSGGTTESQEVVDIDKGFSVSGQAEVSGSYAGVGAGVGAGGSYSKNIEMGTRSLGQQDRSRIESTDSGREARESFSHTTQITQMYTLLQAYHVGTNRVMFYISPRPHAVEEPSGFIRGPRQIDGMQEFFLIVNQDAKQELPCLSVRLDTGHLTVIDQTDYDESEPPTELSVSAVGLPPSELDPNKLAAPEGNDPGFSFNYDCYQSVPSIDQHSATARAGYVVKQVVDIGPVEVLFGSTDVVLDPRPPQDSRSVTLTARAQGHACYRNGNGDAGNTAALTAAGSLFAGPVGTLGGLIAGATGSDAPGFEEVKAVVVGYARRTVRVHWRSETKTKKTGEKQVLLVTTRVLCCCDEPSTPPKIVEIVPLPVELEVAVKRPPVSGSDSSSSGGSTSTSDNSGGGGDTTGSGGVAINPGIPGTGTGVGTTTRTMSARVANELGTFIVNETARVASSVSDPVGAPALDGELALARVAELTRAIPRLTRLLARPAKSIEGLGADAEKRLTEVALPGSPAGDAPNREAVAATSTGALAERLGVSEPEAVTLRLAALGFGRAPRAKESPAKGNPSGSRKR